MKYGDSNIGIIYRTEISDNLKAIIVIGYRVKATSLYSIILGAKKNDIRILNLLQK